MAFGISEFTLVFRRTLRSQPGMLTQRVEWVPVRFSRSGRGVARLSVSTAPEDDNDGVAQVFIVPLCSTLALDDAAYEWFLQASGALDDACGTLATLSLDDAEQVEIARKQIQSTVMAAEVQHIVDSMPA